jgi:hypothetical protein
MLLEAIGVMIIYLLFTMYTNFIPLIIVPLKEGWRLIYCKL